MKRKIFFQLFIAVSFCSCNAQTQLNNNSLKLITSILLPDVSGRIDHLAFDTAHQIVFVAALGNNTIEAVDLKNKKVIHSIKNLYEPQGVAFIPESNSIFVANGDNGECDAFNANTFQKINSIKLSGDADNVRYDATTKKIYVGYGNGGIAVIDATNFKLVNEIKLDEHPESFQIDKAANRIYVNVPDEKQIEIIDIEKNVVINKWKITEAAFNFPMALDNANHRLFIGCRHPAKLLVIDTQTGKTISTLNIDSDADDIFYNSNNKEIYVSCGSGDVNVFKQSDANTYITNGKVSTRSGVRTSLFIPELNQLIVAAPSHSGKEAALFVYSTE
jgi:DNA-binding beta-propeller fold protein YncE